MTELCSRGYVRARIFAAKVRRQRIAVPSESAGLVVKYSGVWMHIAKAEALPTYAATHLTCCESKGSTEFSVCQPSEKHYTIIVRSLEPTLKVLHL